MSIEGLFIMCYKHGKNCTGKYNGQQDDRHVDSGRDE